MVRLKIAGILLVLFVGVGVFVYGETVTKVERAAAQDVDGSLNRARNFVSLRRTLLDHAALERARMVAGTPKIVELLSHTPQTLAGPEAEPLAQDKFSYRIHQSVYEEILVWDSKFKAQSGRNLNEATLKNWNPDAPDLLAVVNAGGTGVAEARDAARYGDSAQFGKEFPVVMQVLKTGRGVKDIWTFRGAPISVAAVPVRAKNGQIVGAVILGYYLTAAGANAAKQLIQADVAYLIGGRLAGTSSLSPTDEKTFGAALNEKVAQAKTDRGLFEIGLGEDRYRVSWMFLKGYASEKAAFAVLKNRSAVIRQGKQGILIIPIALFAAAFLSIIGVMVVFSRYDAQFRSLDKGVLEIINGGLDYWFEVPGAGVPSTMAQNLNIMVCQLSGRPLPDDDDEVQTQHWVRDQLFVDAIDPDEIGNQPIASSVMDTGQLSALSQDMVRLVRDDDKTYHRKTFKDYVDALEQTGQPMAGLTVGLFIRQLEDQAEKLKARLGCARVRFLVEIENGKATLKPVPLD